jgi:hypothetical protein
MWPANIFPLALDRVPKTFSPLPYSRGYGELDLEDELSNTHTEELASRALFNTTAGRIAAVLLQFKSDCMHCSVM